MPIKFPVSEFFEGSGSLAYTFPAQLRDAIATHACNIWASYPKYFTNGRNPVSSYARGFMNSACSPLGNPPPSLAPPFTGGQCAGVQYTMRLDALSQLNGQGEEFPRTINALTVGGKVIGVEYDDSQPVQVVQFVVQHGNGVVFTNFNWNLSASQRLVPGSVQVSFFPKDGSPDLCGNPPPEYPPEPEPTQDDLSTTINIVNIDNFDSTFELQYNNTNSSFNFPMSFKLNGTNVTLDVSGITIFGDPLVFSPNIGNESLPPGSDGGKDVEGNDYVDTFPDTEFPTAPELVQPKMTPQSLETVVCSAGELTPLLELLPIPSGYESSYRLLLAVLTNVVEEICGLDKGEIGFPEIYPVLPGVNRPIIMYYYKEIINGKKQPSTYVSTLPNPNSGAIEEIENVDVPSRTLGKFVASLKLKDGSRIVARGSTESSAISQWEFLLSRVSSAFVPLNPSELRVITQNPRLEVVEVECTQIEFYPFGKSFGRSPSIVRNIDVEVV